jgi:hypothetical protein
MEEKKLTNEETEKALYCCAYDAVACNEECPLATMGRGCTQKMAIAALALIDYKREEIKRLTAFKNEAISMSLYGKGRKDGEEIAVKDTAKEILQELSDFVDFETFREGYELTKVKRKIKEIAKEKGVEVE